jgi:hypothetical protein
MIKDSKYIQDNNVNKEYYKQIFDDNVVEVIVIKDFIDKKDVKSVYNKDFKFHSTHGTWKDLCYKNIFMWDTVSVEIIRNNKIYDLFTYEEINA